jgi:hypothetical protein
MADGPGGRDQDVVAGGRLRAYAALGIAFVLGFMAPVGTKGPKVLLALAFLLGWIFYGALTLMRVVPRYREPPRCLMHFGVADIVLLSLIFGCAP